MMDDDYVPTLDELRAMSTKWRRDELWAAFAVLVMCLVVVVAVAVSAP